MARLNQIVDFTYKDNALRNTYDIESTPDLFTLAMINDKSLSLMLYGNDQFKDLDEKELIRQMIDFASKPANMEDLGITDPSQLDYNVYLYTNTEESIKQFSKDMMTMLMCKPLSGDKKCGHDFVEYCGWNSARYDLQLIVCIKLLCDFYGAALTPKLIRRASNAIIRYDGKPYKFAEYLEDYMGGAIKQKDFRYYRNLALWFDGHIDWAAIAKTEDSGEERQFPPGLKKEMAKFGMDIIIDTSVADDFEKIWSTEDKENLVDYNFNDVLGTKQTAKNQIIASGLDARDMVRRMYPYTSARATSLQDLQKYEPAARDATAASVAGLVLIGPERKKPVDYPAVDFTFPVPDGKGGTKKVDLLEYMKENEAFMHPHLYTFFSHFRGKDTLKSWELKQIIAAQPITHSAIINIPYYRDGKPTDTAIAASTGGAHGFVKAGLSKMNEAEVDAWIRSGEGANKAETPTIDVKNIWHADWSSFYPVMASKMGMYLSSDGVDRYTSIIDYRIQIKDKMEEFPDRSTWTSDLYKMQEDQMGLKFVLNNATGAGNTHNPYALLPLDNKTLSMRLIGNMNIWCLAQRLTQAGAFLISTNTDGVYFCNMDGDTAKKIIDEYVELYGMGVDPVPLDRFINRDTSNRVEYVNGHRNQTAGRLRFGNDLTFPDSAIGRNISYPIVSCNAALEYMDKVEDWLQKPYDNTFIRNYIESLLEDDKFNIESWYHINVAKTKKLTVNDEVQQGINRLVLTKDGDEFGTITSKTPKKANIYHIWKQLLAGKDVREVRTFSNREEDLERIQTVDGKQYNLADLTAEEAEKLQSMPDRFKVESRELKTKTKYSATIIAPVEWDEACLNRLDLSNPKAVQMLIKSTNQDGDTIYLPANVPAIEMAKDIFNRICDSSDAKFIGFKNKESGQYEPLLEIAKSKKLTNYTSNIGKVLNTHQSLLDFDKAELDVDAYVLWAENLLAGWKVSCDLPALGMKSIDDTVVVGSKSVKKLTKKDVEISKLADIYLGMVKSDEKY